MSNIYFTYGETEIEYLKSKDKKLGEVIDKIGYINRKVNPDLFSAIIHSIVGQQISTKAHQTIWMRMSDALGEITADTILNAGVEKVQQFGTTFRKADYIMDFAHKVKSGELYVEDISA